MDLGMIESIDRLTGGEGLVEVVEVFKFVLF